MQFQIGEKVVFLRETGGGIVRRIEDHIIYIEDETGFERPFKQNDLAKVHGTHYDIPEDESVIYELSDGINLSTTNSSKIRITGNNTWEIDLHIEELIDVYGENLIRNKEEALLKQMAVFKEFYHKARVKKVRKIIVIHGVGKGILRQELHDYLRGQNGVDFFDAPYTEYGQGATQVEIRYKF